MVSAKPADRGSVLLPLVGSSNARSPERPASLRRTRLLTPPTTLAGLLVVALATLLLSKATAVLDVVDNTL